MREKIFRFFILMSLQERVREQSVALRQLLDSFSETQKSVTSSSSSLTTTATASATDLDSLLLRDQLDDANEASLVLEQDLAAVTALCLKKAKRCEELSAAVARLEREKVALHRMLIDGNHTASSSYSSLVFPAFLSTSPFLTSFLVSGNATEDGNSTANYLNISTLFRILQKFVTGLVTFVFSILSHSLSSFASIVFAFGLAFIAESYISAPFPSSIPSHSAFTFIVPIFDSYSFFNLFTRTSELLYDVKAQEGNSLMGHFSEWGRIGSIGFIEQVVRKLKIILLINPDDMNKERDFTSNRSQHQVLLSRSFRQVIAPIFVSFLSLYFLFFVIRRSRRTWATLVDILCSLFVSIVMVKPIYMNTESKVLVNEEELTSSCNRKETFILSLQSISCWVKHSCLTHPFSLAVALTSAALGTWTVGRWRSSRDLSRPRVYISESRLASATEALSIQMLFFSILDASVCVLSILVSGAYVLNLLNTGANGKIPSNRWSFGMFLDDVSIGYDLSALSTLLSMYWLGVLVSMWVSARQGRVRAYAMRLGLLASGTSEEGEISSGNSNEIGGFSHHSSRSSNSLSLLQVHEKECAAAESSVLATLVAAVVAVFGITVAFSSYSACSYSSISTRLTGSFLHNNTSTGLDGDVVGGGGGGICFSDPSLYSDGLPPANAADCGSFTSRNSSAGHNNSASGASEAITFFPESVLLSPGTWLLSFVASTLSTRPH